MTNRLRRVVNEPPHEPRAVGRAGREEIHTSTTWHPDSPHLVDEGIRLASSSRRGALPRRGPDTMSAPRCRRSERTEPE